MLFKELLEELHATKEETVSFFELNDHLLHKSYAPNKWNIRFLLHHLADAETVLFERIRRTISNPNQVIWAFDQDKWAIGLQYEKTPLAISKNLYLATRESVIYYTETFYETHHANSFVHSEAGLRTLADEMQKVAKHNRHHLNQIEKALQY